jgi:hypothetical protein
LEDIDQIRTHDILFLAHTKNDGYLCLDEKRDRFGRLEKTACIKLPSDENKTGYHSFTCLWEI